MFNSHLREKMLSTAKIRIISLIFSKI